MVESDDPESSFPGRTIDVSEHGAKVEAKAALTPGQTLSLVQPGHPRQSLRCKVIWAGEVGSDGHSQAGLEFLAPASAAIEN